MANLSPLGVHVSDVWREGFAEFKARQGPGLGGDENSLALAHWLHCDISQAGSPCLAPDLHTKERDHIPGPVVLQVNEAVNIAVTVSEQKAYGASNRTLRLALTDGHQTFYAIELEPIPELIVGLPYGFKVALRDVTVRRGIALISPGRLHVVGGSSPLAPAPSQPPPPPSNTPATAARAPAQAQPRVVDLIDCDDFPGGIGEDDEAAMREHDDSPPPPPPSHPPRAPPPRPQAPLQPRHLPSSSAAAQMQDDDDDALLLMAADAVLSRRNSSQPPRPPAPASHPPLPGAHRPPPPPAQHQPPTLPQLPPPPTRPSFQQPLQVEKPPSAQALQVWDVDDDDDFAEPSLARSRTVMGSRNPPPPPPVASVPSMRPTPTPAPAFPPAPAPAPLVTPSSANVAVVSRYFESNLKALVPPAARATPPYSQPFESPSFPPTVHSSAPVPNVPTAASPLVTTPLLHQRKPLSLSHKRQKTATPAVDTGSITNSLLIDVISSDDDAPPTHREKPVDNMLPSVVEPHRASPPRSAPQVVDDPGNDVDLLAMLDLMNGVGSAPTQPQPPFRPFAHLKALVDKPLSVKPQDAGSSFRCACTPVRLASFRCNTTAFTSTLTLRDISGTEVTVTLDSEFVSSELGMTAAQTENLSRTGTHADRLWLRQQLDDMTRRLLEERVMLCTVRGLGKDAADIVQVRPYVEEEY